MAFFAPLGMEKAAMRRLLLLLDLYFYFTKLTPFTTPTFEIFYRVWSQDFGWFLGGKGA